MRICLTGSPFAPPETKSHRDHVSLRPSTKINSKLATAAIAIHAALRRIGPTCSSSLRPHPRIMLGRLKRPAFAPKVDGSAEAAI